MAVTVEYQSWLSGAYNWLDKTTATSAPLQIDEKLSAWIAAVNANASNATRQLSIKKGPSNSTSTNFIGWVIELASSTTGAGPFYVRFYTSTTTNLIYTASAAWTDNGTNGGYGQSSGNTSNSSSNSFYTSAQLAEFSIATETANGQEFFCLGWRQASNNSYSYAILIAKDKNGEWATLQLPGGSFGSFYMPTHTTPQRNYSPSLPILCANDNTGALSSLVMTAASLTTYAPSFGNEWTASVAFASPALYYTKTSGDYGYGRWAAISGSRKAVCMSHGNLWIVF